MTHDYAKERSDADFLAKIAEKQLDPDLVNWGNNVWHGIVGAEMVKDELGIENEDILTAVEESVFYLNPPVQTVFQEFASRIRLVNPDIGSALNELKTKIHNDTFEEWCDALQECQTDRSLKTILTPIVAKLSDMRLVNADLEYMVYEPRREFITMVILVVGNIPLLYFLNQDWYNALMTTVIGQVMLSITAAVIFFSAAKVVQLTKPIEYRR